LHTRKERNPGFRRGDGGVGGYSPVENPEKKKKTKKKRSSLKDCITRHKKVNPWGKKLHHVLGKEKNERRELIPEK